MLLNWNKLFSNLNKKQRRDKQMAWDRRLQWYGLEKEIKRIFEEINLIAKNNHYYENMYFDTTDEMHADGMISNQKSIFILLGNRPTHLRLTTHRSSIVINSKIMVEKGGCLSFAQGGGGKVAVIYNFPSSKVHRRDELVPKIYKQPLSLSLNNRIIYRHIYRFIKIEQHCSIYGTLPITTRIWLFWHDKKYHFVNAFIAAVTGLVTSLAATIIYKYFEK